VKNLSDLLMNPQCKLEELQLVTLYCIAVTVILQFTVYFKTTGLK